MSMRSRRSPSGDGIGSHSVTGFGAAPGESPVSGRASVNHDSSPQMRRPSSRDRPSRICARGTVSGWQLHIREARLKHQWGDLDRFPPSRSNGQSSRAHNVLLLWSRESGLHSGWSAWTYVHEMPRPSWHFMHLAKPALFSGALRGSGHSVGKMAGPC